METYCVMNQPQPQPQPQQQQQVAAYSPGTPFEVQDTPEFRRVLGLPRRDWEAAAQHNDLYLRMTAAYKQREGTQEMRPIQASALADAHDKKGLLAPIAVGMGKTLISFLLPTVMRDVKRPCLLLPAGLIEKTWREFQVGPLVDGVREPLRKHWICPPAFLTRNSFDKHIISYEILGRDSGKEKLNNLRPDLIICDEAHKLRNPQAACTKKVWRYMLANPTTMFCGMSGTITKRSIRDYWHLAFWALRHNMPLPRPEAEMEKWAEALDEKKMDATARRQGGVLLQFCSPEDLQEINPPTRAPGTLGLTRTAQMPELQFRAKLTAARKGYQRRLRETPGIICSPDEDIDCSLVVRRLDVEPNLDVQAYLETLREEWLTPNGDLLTMPTEVWRHARTLACGFYQRWQPPPSKEWMDARRSWNWTVRQVLDPVEGIYHSDYQHLNLDSPMQVALALSATEAREERFYLYDEDGETRLVDANGQEIYENRQVPAREPTIADPHIRNVYQRWKEVRSTYKINTVAEWIDDSMLRYCLDWMSRNGPANIVWVESRAFGQKLAEMAGTGFCSNGGLDANGVYIEDYKGRTVVASIKANSEGRNLQYDWYKNLIVTVSPTGALVQQLIGRTHRLLQPEDTVYIDWICACEEQIRGHAQIMADARYIQESTGTSQKILFADHI